MQGSDTWTKYFLAQMLCVVDAGATGPRGGLAPEPVIALLIASTMRCFCVCGCRARKLASTDWVMVNHVRNIYHMHRRIDERDSKAERKRNPAPWDTTINPVYHKRTNKNDIALSVASWLPRLEHLTWVHA